MDDSSQRKLAVDAVGGGRIRVVEDEHGSWWGTEALVTVPGNIERALLGETGTVILNE